MSKVIENLKKAFEVASTSRHLVSLEIAHYGLLVRASEKTEDGQICQINNGLPWEALELDNVIENQIEMCLLAIDQTLKCGDQKLSAKARRII